MRPKFSVVIPVYNRRDFLLQAIDSCLRQTTSSIEIIVCDDCSSEDLRSAVGSFREPRVHYYRNEIRLGAARNHQTAASRARGLYVLTLNSDDFLLPECLEVAGRALDEWNGAAAAYFSMTYLEGSTVQGSQPMPDVPFADNCTLLENPWLEGYHGTSPTCCLFRKAAFDGIGGYRPGLRFAYDWDLYMRFMRIGGGVVFVPEVLSVYRKHPEQMVNRRSIDGLLDVLDLWRLPEYSHWPPSRIASLVLTHFSATIRKGGNLIEVLDELRRHEVRRKLLSGMPVAFFRKACFLRGNDNVVLPANYRAPNGIARAIQTAGTILRVPSDFSDKAQS
jgi:glycosyltransferase involved in cell wall biosynthesis